MEKPGDASSTGRSAGKVCYRNPMDEGGHEAPQPSECLILSNNCTCLSPVCPADKKKQVPRPSGKPDDVTIPFAKRNLHCRSGELGLGEIDKGAKVDKVALIQYSYDRHLVFGF